MQDLELDSDQVGLEQDLDLEELGLDFSPVVEELDQEALDQELVEVDVIYFLFNLINTDYDYSLKL